MSLFNSSSDSELQINNLKNSIKFQLVLGQNRQKNIDPRQAKCSYWNQTAASWSDDNCQKVGEKIKILADGEKQYIINCECNHLTDFGVIFDPDSIPVPKWMDRFSDFSLGLSLLGTLITLGLHISVPHMHQRPPQKLFIRVGGSKNTQLL